MIVHDNKAGLFNLHTENTTYQMKVDDHRVLLHTYYGPRIGGDDLSVLIRYADRGFSPNPAEVGHDRTYSLDTLPQEYSGSCAGDFRLTSVEAEFSDGSAVVDLRYTGFERREGKYTLDGLPAFHGDGWETLVLFMEDAVTRLKAELYYGVQEQYDLITRAVRIVNDGDEPVRLRKAASLCLDLQRADMDLITLDGRHVMERCVSRGPVRSGVQSVGSIRGASSHQHNPFVVLCDTDAGEDHGLCYGAMLLYSGNFEAAVERSQFEDCRLVMGISSHRFCYTLTPGESFTAPEAAMVCSPDGLTPMSHRFHRAIRERLIRDPYRDRRRPVLINSWEAAYMDFDAEKLVDIAREAADLGIELFVLDDGWFGRRNNDDCALGDWRVNEKKLPGGLGALVPRINALGMKFGLWIEPEMVSEDSELYRTHPDWVLGPSNRPLSRSRVQLVLDFSRQEVRDNIFRALKAVLDSAPVDYIKWDMNRSLTEVWSAALPAERQGEVYHRYVLGVYELLERFRTQWPELLIEGCSGGGGRFDAGMLYYTPQIWCSDNNDAIDRLRIQHGTSFAYPPHTMGAHVAAVPNAHNGRVTPLQTRSTVALSGTFGYELDPRELTEEEKKTVRHQIEAYKAHWELIQHGEYYRLTDPAQSPYTAWEHVSPDRSRALVSLVYSVNYAAQPFRTLRLKGLDPTARYRVNGGESWAGDTLMQAGYPLPMPMGDYSSLQLSLEAEKKS